MHVLNQEGYHIFLIYNSPLEDHTNPKMPKRPLLHAILNVSLKQKMFPWEYQHSVSVIFFLTSWMLNAASRL